MPRFLAARRVSAAASWFGLVACGAAPTAAPAGVHDAERATTPHGAARATAPHGAARATAPHGPHHTASDAPTAVETAAATARCRPAAPAARPQPSRLLVLGDSLSAQSARGAGWLAVVAERCGARLVIENHARGGAMVNQLRRRFEELPTFEPGTAVLLFAGVNDLLSDRTAGRTPALIEQDIRAIGALTAARGGRFWLFTTAPWGGARRFTPERATAMDALLAAERALAGSVAERVFDAYELLRCGVALCTDLAEPFHDGIHLGPYGQQQLGERVVAELFPECAQTARTAASSDAVRSAP